MTEQTRGTLILGIGNDILTDDGIGPRLVNELKEQDPLPDTTYRTTTLGGLEILEAIQGYERVVFVDAIKTRNGRPGTVYRFTPEDFRETLHLSNLHDISFLTAIELGRQMKMAVPEHLHIIAIEIIEDLVFSENFSPEINRKYPAIREEIATIIREMIRPES